MEKFFPKNAIAEATNLLSQYIERKANTEEGLKNIVQTVLKEDPQARAEITTASANLLMGYEGEPHERTIALVLLIGVAVAEALASKEKVQES